MISLDQQVPWLFFCVADLVVSLGVVTDLLIGTARDQLVAVSDKIASVLARVEMVHSVVVKIDFSIYSLFFPFFYTQLCVADCNQSDTASDVRFFLDCAPIVDCLN